MGIAESMVRQKELEKQAKQVPNINLLGYVDKFSGKRFYSYIDKSWILVNTASREAFPLTFFEAGGRGCAILSHVNPDNIAKTCGYWAKEEDFERGLKFLLSGNRWKSFGKKAHEYFTKETNNSLDKHLKLYEKLLK